MLYLGLMKLLACQICCMLFFSFTGIAQFIPVNEQAYVDSLVQVMQTQASDSAKARTGYLLADYWSARDTVKSRQYLMQAQSLGNGNGYLQALYFFYRGGLLFDQDTAKSAASYLTADSLLKKYAFKEAYLFRARAWHNNAIFYQMRGDKKNYLDLLLNSVIPLSKQAGDLSNLGNNYIDVAIELINEQQYREAEKYCLRGIALLEQTSSTAGNSLLIYAYTKAAENYNYLEKPLQAEQMLDKARPLLAPNPESELYLDFYHAEALCQRLMHQYENATISVQKGLILARELRNKYAEKRLLFQAYKVYFEKKDYKVAKSTLQELLDTMPLLDNERANCYFSMAETCAGLRQMDEAYNWQKKYSGLSDSIYSVNLKKNIVEIETKYKSAEQEKAIKLLQAKNESAVFLAQNRKTTNWLLSIISIFLFLAAAAVWAYYRNSKRLAQQKEVNYLQQLKAMEQQQQLTATQAMLEGEERERQRMARDLHDGLGGMLAGVKINLSGWAANHQDIIEDNNLYKVISQLDSSVSELRRIARNMMPETLLKFGLEIALKDLCEFYMNDNIHLDYQAFCIQKDLPLSVQISIYRIVQEILSNAIRHAHAHNIVLQCSQEADDFLITLEDDGIGFDTSILSQKKGMGLNNIKNRVEYLKGKMEIVSATGEGTTINIELKTNGKS